MNGLTEKLVLNFSPRLAIVAYTSTANEWSDVYLESHEIGKDGGLLEGKPLRQETIQGMVDVLFDDRNNKISIKGILPASLLFFEFLPGGQYAMVWYRPAERRMLHFAKDLEIKSGEAWVPAMIYKVHRSDLTVFALASDERPVDTTNLFLAPFHNISESGSVCLGNAKVQKPKERTYASLMHYWESLFWLSEFSHLNGSRNPTNTNINVLWPRLIRNKKMTWAEIQELKPHGKKMIKDIL